MDIIDYAKLIYNWLEEEDASVVKFLQEGKSKREINERIANLPIKLPAELLSLYTWKNGTVNRESALSLRHLCFFPTMYFLTLEEAIDIYKRITYLIPNKDFSFDFFPIFYDSGGNYLVIECNKKSDSIEGRIFELDFESEDIFGMYFDSLTIMFKTIWECFKNRVYIIKDGYLRYDSTKESEIMKELNPKTSEWYSSNHLS
ncbi:SMI1/KNR4 family protein [Thermoflexibacter ruber]|uniref:SMI1 / KNR4 family (SUKH-1) n=1 Tax=Thermoflexibacter ruber TaxID=1003 RepID=A0A1I2KCL4_9BACT|nr:SMI1/KNR4 family protein [Thermoflexibacter ruber]SFF62686.1 SMI1 / KNR4 family (SUKH-1) [Thermoflexibacter ruber]